VRVAIVHDWLVTYAGAERVLEQILLEYPEADLYSLVDFMPEAERRFLGGRPVRTSFLQHVPFARRRYRGYLPLMPLAIEQFDLSAYDLVISSWHAVAKGVITGPDQLHVCYCNSPFRYVWDLQHQYLSDGGLDRGLRSWMARYVLHRMRLWDYRTANGVDEFLVNSRYAGRRIWKYYRRESSVVYPPVDTETFVPGGAEREDFYVTAGRMVPYKRLDLIAEAFAGMPERRLVVLGDGPEMQRVRARSGPNVSLPGYQSAAVLRDHLQRARGFIIAGPEDFGIAAVEALACGTPVLAYRRGGVLETVQGPEHPQPTGVFFEEQSAQAIQAAVERFEREAERFSARNCRESSLRFGVDRFRQSFRQHVGMALERFERGREGPTDGAR
jgi:glycosyltransferase involved in cell wall biosynthesis